MSAKNEARIFRHAIWAVACVLVVVLAVIFLLANSFLRAPAKIAETIADALTNENITITFSAFLPHLGADDGLKLELKFR